MKAVVQHKYGKPQVLRVVDVEKPTIEDDQVLVKVHAASVNPADWHYMTGTPILIRVGGGGLLRPKREIPGLDLAGVVEAVGAKVTEFEPGDEVFGESSQTFAEYAAVAERHVVHKPENLTMDQAATMGVAAYTAIQGLRDKGQLTPGQDVLVVGASGGVGTFAVQIAKAMGATVTAVCSTRNIEMVRSLGADGVVDYTKDDYTKLPAKFDLVLDTVGNRSLADNKAVMKPQGIYVGVGGPKRVTKILFRMLRMAVASRLGSRKMKSMLAKGSKTDLVRFKEMAEAGELVPVIDRTYKLEEIVDAMTYQGEGHAQGKTVVAV